MQEDYNHVILVDSEDRELGMMEKLQAHREGLLHRAFSIFLFNDKGEMLLQKRAGSKYHTPGLWTNTCCSHPAGHETLQQALARKMMQEMGIVCPLEKAFTFTYRSELDNGLIEYELDHVFVGRYNGEPNPNPDEVSEWKYVDPHTVGLELINRPADFTPWFRMLFAPVTEHYRQYIAV